MTGFLLDTNVISELIRPRPERTVTQWIEATDEALMDLSVLTLGEARKGMASLRRAPRRAAIESWLERSLRPRFAGRILAVDENVADRWGILSGRAIAQGRPIPVLDGLLAATALHHNLTLVTRNAGDIERTGVHVLSPWEA